MDSSRLINIAVRNRNGILTLLKVSIALSLIAYLIFTVSFKGIMQAFSSANPLFLFSAVILGIPNLWLQYYRWEIISRHVLSENDKRKIAASIFYGFSAGIATPFRLGEYVGRAVAFRDNDIIKVSAATALDKMFPLIVTAFTGSATSILFFHYYYNITVFVTILLLFIHLAASCLIFYTLLKSGSRTNSIMNYLSTFPKIKSFLDHLRSFRSFDMKAAGKVMVATLLFYLCIILQYALLVAAFSSSCDLIEFMWIGSLVLFAKSVIPPVSLGDLGIREGASVFFISAIGLDAATGFNSSITLFFINVLAPSVVGFFFLFNKD